MSNHTSQHGELLGGSRGESFATPLTVQHNEESACSNAPKKGRRARTSPTEMELRLVRRQLFHATRKIARLEKEVEGLRTKIAERSRPNRLPK